MESKAMLPDSTQSETLAPTASSSFSSSVSSSARPLPSSGEGSLHGSSTAKTRDKPKKKSKRKSEDRGSKTSKKKKTTSCKEKPHKEEASSKSKSKKENVETKKVKVEGEDSDLDLGTELKPIRDYLKDREEMLRQMFRCLLKADKLRAMLPDILHGLKTEELQELCLRQLEGMSKSRIMSILAGEEMQSSSDDEDESDLDAARTRPESTGGPEERQINSEVVDSTSSLTQLAPSVGDAEEAVSLREEEKKASAEETSVCDADDAPELEAEADVASGNGSWHGDGGEQWDDQVARGDEDYDEMEAEAEEAEREQDVVSSKASSPRVDDEGDVRQSDPHQDHQDDVSGEAAPVGRVKKFRRVKIVRAEGEDCEEGEITSDEVETDGDSDSSRRGENSQSDVDDIQCHSPSRGSGVATEAPANSGNQGNDDDDNNTDDLVVDTDDASARAGETLAGETVAGDAVAACDDSLNVYAEESLESETEERSSLDIAKEAGRVSDRANNRNNASKEENSGGNASDDVSEECADIEGDRNGSTIESDSAEARERSGIAGEGATPDPTSAGQGQPAAAKAPGHKMAQQLEVLELELRARAIRSLMKQYRKDVK